MNTNEQPQIISYTILRRTLGILGVLLPIVLVIGAMVIGNCCEVQSSISNYYYTRMRNVFVGFLCAYSLFLWAYKGYPGNIWDNWLGNIACILGLGVAFLPTAVDETELTSCITTLVDNGIIGWLHLFCAASFFIVLAIYSIFIFTKGSSSPTSQKKKRNRLYRICGYTMLVNILLMAIYVLVFRKIFPAWEKAAPVFWLEAIALWAFGISWLTKGEVFLTDPVSNNE